MRPPPQSWRGTGGRRNRGEPRYTAHKARAGMYGGGGSAGAFAALVVWYVQTRHGVDMTGLEEVLAIVLGTVAGGAASFATTWLGRSNEPKP